MSTLIRFSSGTTETGKKAGGLLAVLVSEADLKKNKASGVLGDAEKLLRIKIRDRLKSEKFTGKSGETKLFRLSLSGSAPDLLVLGVGGGKSNFEKSEQARKVGASLERLAKEVHAKSVTVLGGDETLQAPTMFCALVEGLYLSSYEFTQFKSSREKRGEPSLKSVHFATRKKIDQKLVHRASVLARATCLARDLVNLPPSECPPSRLVAEARKLTRNTPLQCKVYQVAQLKKLHAGGILGVSRGSSQPPALIQITYRPKKRSKRVVALVGKGVTFDSGGLSIKTGSGMETMKCDMAGAAAVLGAMQVVAALKPSFEVRGYIPTVENMINGNALKPGDVLRHVNGKTVEVLNTDAEGRLILADALSLACREGASEVIDLATLTGACVVALGDDYAGLFTDDNALAEGLVVAAESSGERLWRLPLAPEYEQHLKSPVADIKNTGSRYGGAITAALFLKNFVKDTRWAHLDIAGPAFAEKSSPYCPRGGTGFAVRTLANYLLS